MTHINPTIDDCITQDITDPAVLAAYILDPPVHDDQTPLVVATKYPYTVIEQDGAADVQAEITATCKVIGNIQ